MAEWATENPVQETVAAMSVMSPAERSDGTNLRQSQRQQQQQRRRRSMAMRSHGVRVSSMG